MRILCLATMEKPNQFRDPFYHFALFISQSLVSNSVETGLSWPYRMSRKMPPGEIHDIGLNIRIGGNFLAEPMLDLDHDVSAAGIGIKTVLNRRP